MIADAVRYGRGELNGFTVTKASYKAIKCDGVDANVVNCKIMANEYGIYCDESNAVENGSDITDNEQGDGERVC